MLLFPQQGWGMRPAIAIILTAFSDSWGFRAVI
jgi:hypothetical protein